jgi:RimJ/RimL family protein N-acetyltransferase
MATATQYVAGTDRLLLRPLTHDDVECVGRWLQDPAIARAYLGSAESFGVEDVAGVLDWAAQEEAVNAWAIDHRDGGLVASSNTRPDFPWTSVFEAEVTLSPDLPKRQGYGLEAHHLVVDHVFTSRPEAKKVMGRAIAFNHAAIAIMGRLGLSQEGCLRRHVDFGGEEFDFVIYGVLRAEWEQTRPAARSVALPSLSAPRPAQGRR